MPVPTRLVTADELLRMPDDGFQYELIRGVLRRMPPPGWQHGLVSLRLGAALFDYVEANGLGAVTGNDSGYWLERDPDTVRGPDIAFVRRERLGDTTPRGYWSGAPDLAVEVRSPHDRASEIEEKIRDYVAAKCNEVWVVDPDQQVVVVYLAGAAPRVLGEADTLQSDMLPGFRYPVARLFAPVAHARG